MTNKEASCPQCGHSPLNHKRGRCLVIVTYPLPNGMRGEECKGHCGCDYYSPLDAIQITFKGIALEFDK